MKYFHILFLGYTFIILSIRLAVLYSNIIFQLFVDYFLYTICLSADIETPTCTPEYNYHPFFIISAYAKTKYDTSTRKLVKLFCPPLINPKYVTWPPTLIYRCWVALWASEKGQRAIMDHVLSWPLQSGCRVTVDPLSGRRLSELTPPAAVWLWSWPLKRVPATELYLGPQIADSTSTPPRSLH